MKTKNNKFINFIIYQYKENNRLDRIVKNAGLLLSGNVGAALIGLITFALIARTIGPSELGKLAMITAYVAVIDKLINFQCWQALIKYGSGALINSQEDFKSILKFGYILDIGGAMAAAIISATSVWFFGSWLNFDQETIALTSIYSVVAVAHITGAPIAILRIFNKFGLFAIITLTTALFKLICILIISIFKPDLWNLVFVYGLADMFGSILLIMFSLRELKKQGFSEIHSSSIYGLTSRFPGIWSFVFITNINGSIRMVSKEADVLLIGALLSPASVGLYKVGKQISSVLLFVVDPLYHAIYPELTKLNSVGDNKGMIKISITGALVAILVGSVMFVLLTVLSESILLRIFGLEFVASRSVMLWYAFGVFLAVASFPISPLIISKGNPKLLLITLLISTIAYFTSLPWLISENGLSGAGMAYVLFYIIWITVSCAVVFHLFRFKVK